MNPTPHPSTNSAPVVVLGRTQPRIWTPPLRDLNPSTSYGYDVADFARDVLDEPLDPWEEWFVIHAGELLPDGRPRFRTVVGIVARQQGKSHLLRTLILYWMFVEQQPLILATSTDRSYAKNAWRAAVDQAKANPYLAPELHRRPTVEQLGEEVLRTAAGSRYRFAATNRRTGRSLTINRLVLDEIREHHNWEAWSAATFAMNAVPNGQAFAVSNQGDTTSVVLNSLRESAVRHLDNGDGDPRMGIFEWSCPPGSDPTDIHALAHSCPNLGRRTDADTLLGAARRAVTAGGEELTAFRTEVMCQRVNLLDPAIDPDRWARAATTQPVDLAEHRDKVALCLDVSLDGSHAALVAAAAIDGHVHVEVVEAWNGYGCTKILRDQLPDLVRKVAPRVVGWFPAGPGAAVAADLRVRRGWPPRGTQLVEIGAETSAVCMGFAELIAAGDIAQPDDDMLTAHVASAQKLVRGDRWTFTRKGAGPIDGAYAAAGAAHLARTLPPAPAPLVAL